LTEFAPQDSISKKQFMGISTTKEHRTSPGNAIDFAYEPTGGASTMWIFGVGVALIPLVYGIHCLITRHAILFGKQHSNANFYGAPAITLAICYMAVGGFIHFHWFWGINRHLQPFSGIGKILCILAFLPCLGYSIYSLFQSFI
jgi:hypothetical protein